MIVSYSKNSMTGLLLLFAAVACGRSPNLPAGTKSETVETLATVRWTGTERIAADTNSVELQELAKLPESVKLTEQTLDKLSRAPWVLRHIPADTNASILLRPMLDDVVKYGCLFETDATGDQSPAFVIAVRIDSKQSSVWETNLAAVAESLAGNRPSPLADNRPGWILHSPIFNQEQPAPNKEEAKNNPHASAVFTRQNGWTVFGLAENLPAFDSLVKRILDREAKESSSSNLWLKATFDLPRLATRFSFSTNLFVSYPVIDLNLAGKNKKASTEMTLTFARPLDLHLPPWLVPTNLIANLSASFSAIRGLDGLLTTSPAWQNLKLDPPPDQLFVWAFEGEPRFTYFAAHVADAAGFVNRAGKMIVPNGEAWFHNNAMAGFKKSAEHDGVEWQGLPYLWPFLRSVTTNGQSYALGGSFIYTPVVHPLTNQFYEETFQSKDLVYYGWEKTGQRIEHWLFIGQFIRFVSGKAQLPFESPSVLWLKALESRAGESETWIHLTRPEQLRLTRSSSLGATAIELHLLADWLESPEFPRGLHTRLSPPPAPIAPAPIAPAPAQ
jgi:hypothetical protein